MKKYWFLVLVATLGLSACQQTNIPKEIKKESGTGQSIKELLSEGKSQKCMFAYTQEGYETRGLLIIKGNKFKQELSIPQKINSMMLYVISDGDNIYSWNESTPGVGVKMKLKTMEEKGESAENVPKIDLDKKFDFSCFPSEIEDKEFDLPTNVKFEDIAEL